MDGQRERLEDRCRAAATGAGGARDAVQDGFWDLRAGRCIRFGLVDRALVPLEDTLGAADPEAFAQLRRDLAVVVSAKALSPSATCAPLDAGAAVASAVRTATTLTEAAVHAAGQE